MQQQLDLHASQLGHVQHTQPPIPEATISIAGMFPIAQATLPTLPSKSAPQPARIRQTCLQGLLRLLIVGLALAILCIALWPLLAGTGSQRDLLYAAWLEQFPWLPRLYWTSFIPGLALDQLRGRANILLLLVSIACVLVLLAARVGSRLVKGHRTRDEERAILWFLLVMSALLGITMLLAPIANNAMTHDLLLYDLYGRVVAVYHTNPYTTNTADFTHDAIRMLAGANRAEVPIAAETSYGPVWLDLSMLVTLFSGERLGGALLGFRLIGLVAHLLNTALLWNILARLKPEMRVSGTLLYAWNPLVLLLGIAQPHLEMVAIVCILLAISFMQRNSPVLSWAFILLAALLNLYCVLLLPGWLRLIARRGRILQIHSAALWLSTFSITLLVALLAYVPYWRDWGATGAIGQVAHVFWQKNALNSLPAVLLSLPTQIPGWLIGIVTPAHWNVFVLLVIGGFLLLSAWLADTLELVLFCASWLLLLLIVLMPEYWPWYTLLLLPVALCAANRNTLILVLMLTMGGLLCCYYWLFDPVWRGLALIVTGLPLLVWGWTLFLVSTWHMTHANAPVQDESRPRRFGRFSRPSWLSRPSRP